jgi:hypothetical protein
MTPREINKSSIVEYLNKISIKPARKMNGYYMYFSPIRAKEETPSFKVSLVANLWVDFGTNEGGTLIDLILKLNPDYTVSKIVTDFKNGIFSFHQPKQTEKNIIVPNSIKIIKIEPLQDCKQACAYLKSRGVDFSKAGDYVSGISYEIKNITYKGIVAENLNGGYNISSTNFKCATKQGASFYSHNNGKSLVVTEGIIDLLSFVMLYPEQVQLHDLCVLNSVNNLPGIYNLLKNYKQLICFLDNDKAGERATYLIKELAVNNKISCFDYRLKYKEFKDLNDYLQGVAM